MHYSIYLDLKNVSVSLSNAEQVSAAFLAVAGPYGFLEFL